MDGSASVSAEGAGGLADVRPKRSRTGCMTCRNRRRKCDEGKPVCQNCISKGFECRYAAAFQILGKHNFTSEVKNDVQYDSVRFAGDESEEPTAQNTFQSVSLAETPSRTLSAQTQAVDPPSRRIGSSVDTSLQGYAGLTPSPESYEFALHGLLALGSTSTANQGIDFTPTPVTREDNDVSTFTFARSKDVTPNFREDGFQWDAELHRARPKHRSTLSFGSVCPEPPHPSVFQNPEGTEDFDRPQEASSGNSSIFLKTSPADAVATGQSIEILKFYRYNIAPWLDICDADQHFGVELLTHFSRVQSLRSCIARVAAASSSMNYSVEDLTGSDNCSLEVQDGDVSSSSNVEAIVGVLEVLIDMIPNLAACWSRQETRHRRSYVTERILLELEYSTLHACAYWLSVRLELSHVLTGGAHRILLPLLSGQPQGTRSGDSTTHSAYDAIGLCVDSAMFAQGDDDHWLQQRYGLNRVEVWKALVQSFAHWYMHRSQAFQPIIELYSKDGVLTDDDYPTIVFTSGAALLANQLYHTGMLLLLQNKPRFADKPTQNSPSMSTLWHAHRICGIAIQNDRLGWWDPCLVASLIIAGRTATHASQHNAIIRTLQFVQQLTGWDVDPCLGQLKDEWRLADAW